MRFGEALVHARNGKRIARLGWIGKGAYVYMTKGRLIPVDAWETRMPSQEVTDVEREKGFINVMPHLDMMSTQGTRVIGWLASQTDMLAFDWYVVDEEDE